MVNHLEQVKEFDESKAGVKGLCDSSLTSLPTMFIQPPEILSTLRPPSSPKPITIPLINLAGRRSTAVQKLTDAARTYGFFQIINHGIPVSVIDQTINSVKAFHEQPNEAKAQLYGRQVGNPVQYSTNIDLYRSSAATWHDYVQVKMSPEEERARPEEVPEVCRRELGEWDGWVTGVCEKVMEMLCEGLGLEQGKFKELTFYEERVLVGVYYPPCPQPELTFGLKPHSDPCVLTILIENGVPGLQVKFEDEWVDVKPVHGALTVNVGDFLQIVSNDEYKSVKHRVLANSSEEARISAVMFFNANKWNDSGYLGPLPELLSPEKPARYRDFTKQEFMTSFYGKALDGETLPDKTRIL
ncbi:1-aminocyclopropane-1-carboxylate oxidase homolog 4-like [Carica papaya]|uniref:1-aminocyclopropane-1-carboxylate oxidase homolog 4-like n=1 Tax=Carica papaya TaxID=3649 RepID=UPI000B8CF823|nr:1-aminocyclopropane-1-carboxylate oxidase homolog 4-like [Carica papaya]